LDVIDASSGLQPASRARPVSLRGGPELEELCRRTHARGDLIADAQHAALALEHGSEWVSFDRDFARFPDLRWRHPLD